MPDLILVYVFLDYQSTDVNDVNPSVISVDFVAPIAIPITNNQHPSDVSNKAAFQLAVSV